MRYRLLPLIALTACGGYSLHSGTNGPVRQSPQAIRVGAPSPTPNTPTPTPWQSVVAIDVASSCVVPGGRQTENVTAAPGLTVSISLRYPDGKTAYGGAAYGETVPESGVYSHEYTVSQDAPIGSVTVWVGAAKGTQEVAKAATAFTVAAHC